MWFIGAVVLHDLVLFPLYALADRGFTALVRRRGGQRDTPAVPVLNYVRVPVLASGLLLLLFFPGIIDQEADTYLTATGQTQDFFLNRWRRGWVKGIRQVHDDVEASVNRRVQDSAKSERNVVAMTKRWMLIAGALVVIAVIVIIVLVSGGGSGGGGGGGGGY